MPFGGFYILDGKNTPLPCRDHSTWERWARRRKKMTREDQAGEVIVQTRFLGIDCNVRDHGPPLLWNTEVFLAMDHHKHETSLDHELSSSHVDAMLTHENFVATFKEKVVGIICKETT